MRTRMMEGGNGARQRRIDNLWAAGASVEVAEAAVDANDGEASTPAPSPARVVEEEPDPPEAPIWFTSEEASAWHSGWCAGWRAAKASEGSGG